MFYSHIVVLLEKYTHIMNYLESDCFSDVIRDNETWNYKQFSG